MLAIAEAAVHRAEQLLRYAGQDLFQIEKKASGEEVTAVDRKVQDIIFDYLRDATPDIPFLGEETAGGKVVPPASCWVLDPIDGTMNIGRGSPFWAISLALISRSVPELGVISAPALHYSSSSIVQSNPPGGRRSADLANSIIGITGSDNDERGVSTNLVAKLHRDAYRIRMNGSMCLDLVGVAEGWVDACICIGPKPWDVAAGIALAQSRGFSVLGRNGQNYSWESPFLASGPDELAREIADMADSVTA